jgi:hypothetical protein
MSLSLHIAQGDARRVAGKKGPAKLPARISVLPPHFGLDLYPNTERSDQYMKARREARHHPTALEKQPINESPTMRSFVFNSITTPVVFKGDRSSRRVQLWNRQASIIIDLTTLTLRHRGHCLPRV